MSLSPAFFLTFTWWRIAVILALTCLRPLLSVSFLFSLRLCLSFLNLLDVARVITLDFFLSLSVSLSLQYPFSLSCSLPLCLSLTLSLVLSCSLAHFPSFFPSLSVSVCIWFQDWANLDLESTVRVLQPPHRFLTSCLSISCNSPNSEVLPSS